MGVDRRRDLGQDHCPGEEQEGGQGLREGASAHSQWVQRRIRRIQVDSDNGLLMYSSYAICDPDRSKFNEDIH